MLIARWPWHFLRNIFAWQNSDEFKKNDSKINFPNDEILQNKNVLEN